MEIIRYLRRFKKRTLTVETKDRTTVKGVLVKTDKMMNLFMKDVVVAGEELKEYFIKGSRIRYIILDEYEPISLNRNKRIKKEKITEQPENENTQ